MSEAKESKSLNWKHPDELVRLQRLKQKKKQLAARLNQNNNVGPKAKGIDKESLLEAKIAQKRKNPFAIKTPETKRSRTEDTPHFQDGCLLGFVDSATRQVEPFIRETPTRPPPANLVLQPFDAKTFAVMHKSNNFAVDDDEAAVEGQKFTKHLPMDWSLKTRIRIFCRNELPTTTLKTSQLASGLTSFVRCIDTQNTQFGLDISPATRFSQATYFWQHPHIPWMTLFPRNCKSNNGIVLGQLERNSLADDWDCSFRGLFQLLRARQCPYFYLCANTFTVLFRAAGTSGCVETHALMVPSTRGIRSALRQEGIEYTMPLKKDGALNKSDDGNFTEENSMDAVGEANKLKPADHTTQLLVDDDEEDTDNFLENLEVNDKELRRMQTAHTRRLNAQEMTDDFSDNSLLLIEGVECQGFFSFLLNAKSTISNVGKLAGIPPTLLAPVAFPKATMQNLSTRSSKVRMDDVDYNSIEIKGVMLPSFLPYACDLLGETRDTFSATLASNNNTLAFSKATQRMLEQAGPVKREENQSSPAANETAGQVFGKENLSDCGLLPNVVESMCRTGPNAVTILERVCYDKEYGYAWS